MRVTTRLLAATFALSAAFAMPAFAEGPGSDAFGNKITSSKFDPNIPTGLFHDISTTGALIAVGDDNAGTANLGGLVFPFYGVNYTDLLLSTNGYISTLLTDGGGDLSNDPVLPTIPSTGGGGRIYVYHDDIEARVFGQYFNQASSPIGTETFIAQWNACHFSCDETNPAETTLLFNAMLLRDGTVIMAYDKVSIEAGGGATVGIQNPAATDGVSYLVNEAVMTDGMTIIVYSTVDHLFTPAAPAVVPLGGLGDDTTIAAAELGMLQNNAQSGLVGDAVDAAFAGNSDANVMTASTGTYAMGARINGLSVWAGGSAVGLSGRFGPTVSGRSYGFQSGIDYMVTPWMLGGVSFAYNQARLAVGMFGANQTAYSVEPYVGLLLADVIKVKASFSYAKTRYGQVSSPFGTFSADGNRFAGTLSASTSISLPMDGWALVPEVSISAGQEKIGNLAGFVAIPVDTARFVAAEATAKIEKTFVTGGGTGKIYGLAGVDHVSTNGNNTIALFASNYRNTRTGGVAGAGISFNSTSGFSIDANVVGRGLGTGANSVEGRARIGFTF